MERTLEIAKKRTLQGSRTLKRDTLIKYGVQSADSGHGRDHKGKKEAKESRVLPP